MKKYTNLLVIIITLFFLVELFINKNLVFNTISFSLDIWVNNLIPSLFPMFILSDILITYNFVKYIPKWFINIFSYLFNIKKECTLVFFLSMLSGFPSNAKNIRKLYDMNIINSKEASHMLMFTHFSNPLFILGTLAIFFLNNKKLGIIILLSHYLSNFIIGIIFRKFNTISNNTSNEKEKDLHFGPVFVNAIKSSVDTLLLILGTLTCFLIISAIIINRFNLNSYNSLLIKSILEITMGLKELSLFNFNDLTKVILSSCILSFGGLSVHMQVVSQLIDTDISYKYFFIGRVFQVVISLFLSYFIYFIYFI